MGSGDVVLEGVQKQLIIGSGTAEAPIDRNEVVETADQIPFTLNKFKFLGRGGFEFQ